MFLVGLAKVLLGDIRQLSKERPRLIGEDLSGLRGQLGGDDATGSSLADPNPDSDPEGEDNDSNDRQNSSPPLYNRNNLSKITEKGGRN